MSTIIMLNINCLSTINVHTSISWCVCKEIGTSTDTHSTFSRTNKVSYSFHVFLSKIHILRRSLTSWDNDSIQILQNAIRNITRSDSSDRHIRIQLYGCNRLPNTRLCTAITLENTYTYLVSYSHTPCTQSYQAHGNDEKRFS